MANEQLRLPTGLSAEDYTFGDGSLLDYTPPNVQWQAPLAPQGGSVFGNYVKAHDDLLKTYNRRLARPTGTTGALPLDTSGRPQSMESYGLQHWNEFGSDEDRNLYESLGLWGDPGRSPYIGYGGGTATGAAISGSQARLPQPSVSGYDYAYPVYSRYSHPSGHYGGEERYQPGTLNHPNISYYTKDIDKYPYFPTLPADLAGGTEYNNEPYILVGQTLVPAGDRDEIFSYS